MKNWGKKTLVISLILFSGCSYFQKKGIIKSGNVSVAAVDLAGKPATLNTSDAKESVAIPAGSDVHITETAEVPATDKTPFQPAKKDWSVHFPTGSAWVKSLANVTANTGTVDTSVATAKLEIAERRWLLWVAIGAGIAGIVLKSLLPAWPGLSNGLLLAAVVAGVSWKVAALPDWLWAVGAVIMAVLAVGYKLAESHAATAAQPALPQPKSP